MDSRIGAILVVLSVTLPVLATPSQGRALTFGDRVAAQRAIEQVYWNQRIWPKENPGPKPPLSAVLSEAELRARVATYLRESNALDRFWQRPLSAGQLQAELDRLKKNTRDPGTLRQLLAALGDDPALIAETLARQTLADRLVRGWYANDERIHGEIRARAEAARAACKTAACMASMGGRYSETTWQLAEGSAGAGRTSESSDALEATADETGSSRTGERVVVREEHERGAQQDGPLTLRRGAAPDNHEHTVLLDAQEWKTLKERWTRSLGGSSESLPRKTLGPLEETADAFSVTAILSESADALTTVSVVWDKRPFDEWWRSVGPQLGTTVESPRGMYSIGADATDAIATDGCTVDTWLSVLDGFEKRTGHTAVWTGSEMIVWGGSALAEGGLESGARYNPATDTWTAVSRSLSSPSAGGPAVWTGTEMIVWGGGNNGRRYDPTTDSWLPLAPGPATTGTVVWTGTRMIVWGGYSGGVAVNTGSRYDPSTDSWQATSTAGAPQARYGHTAVWTGNEMIVWGGNTGAYQPVNSGGRYDPSSDTWQATSVSANTPAGVSGQTAVWTGTRMIVWGGYNSSFQQVNSGGRYDPSTDTWQPTSTGAGVPEARISHTAVWTGTQMIVWGGNGSAAEFLDTGARYNPSSDTWVAIPSRPNTPSARYGHTAVWTGTEMIVWGGQEFWVGDYNGEYGTTSRPVNSGGRYSPSADSWVATSIPASDEPTERQGHTAVWTGNEMIVWGGGGHNAEGRTGGRYTPATDSWEPISTSGGAVPAARSYHTAVWTGTEMIVWGGFGNNGPLDSGGRYNPSNDSWHATARNGACPSPRYRHTTVWTGTQMIVWGGVYSGVLNTGGRYTPASDSWTATNTTGAPSGRQLATAVWTGSEMIVWGGQSAQVENTGGRYNPSSNSWQPTSIGAGVPPAMAGHTAVWTGSRMIVWGGTGGRYDPATDTWQATSVGPTGSRSSYSAVWTGTEMIIWGGIQNGSSGVNTGARYNPSSDTWLPTSTSGHVPYPRGNQTAVWTGSEMIVWGGWAGVAEVILRVLGSGGAYCADHCASPATLYRDADGDGYGNPSGSQVTCGSPAGWVPIAGDCDDSRAEAHPGATEVCNGLDDDCDAAIDDGVAVPSGSPSLTAWRYDPGAYLFWSEVPNATGYDVIVGDLALLHASGGDFTSSTAGCVVNDRPYLSVFALGSEPPGGAWYLVRAVNACSGNASYDDGSQQGSRDAEIAASGQACP